MAYYKIEYGCGCGNMTDFIEAENYEDAMDIAHHYAVEDYESYAGYHGVMSIDDIMYQMFGEDARWDDLEDYEQAEIEEEYWAEIQSNIDYSAEEMTYEQWKEEAEEYGN